jgi:hypothetical protein
LPRRGAARLSLPDARLEIRALLPGVYPNRTCAQCAPLQMRGGVVQEQQHRRFSNSHSRRCPMKIYVQQFVGSVPAPAVACPIRPGAGVVSATAPAKVMVSCS